MKNKIKRELKIYFLILFYIIVFNIAITSATIVLHELGHFFTGFNFGCKNIKIILLDDSFNTYTQMNCPESISYNLLAISGFFFILPFCIFLLILKNYEKYYSFIVFGLNLIISLSDIALFSITFLYLFLLAGLFLIICGETLLINKYLIYIERIGSVI